MSILNPSHTSQATKLKIEENKLKQTMKDKEKMNHICNLIKTGGSRKFIIEAIAKYPN